MFDLDKLFLKKNRARNNIANSEICNFIKNDLISRLELIDKKFSQILLIYYFEDHDFLAKLNNLYPGAQITIESKFSIPKQEFDLIIFPMGLHWISDIQEFLSNIRASLKDNGIIVANFAGGGTLQKLRHKLIEAEALCNMPHTPHISPFIRFEQMTPLLQQAGFLENIIDSEELKIEYDSALQLMKFLQKLGESNSLKCSNGQFISKKIYQIIKKPEKDKFIDSINLISFISSPTRGTIKIA